ncbi:MAG: electron transfer flavoprotein subunit alpha/FixB family protein [Desulfomonile sp.]|nr:electron transfer flavoprotein subunit alpha/FixB family protein [Desulfomonile sp.]
MKTIYVLAEHRQQHLRDTTWDALAAGRDLAQKTGAELACLLLGSGVDAMADQLAKECPKVVVVDDPRLANFNSEPFVKTLTGLLAGQDSYVLVIGNSNSIIDLAPGLSVALDAALATDCIGFEVDGGKVKALRQIYSYKVNALVSFKGASRIVATLRSGFFSFAPSGAAPGAIEKVASPLGDEPLRKRFLSYVEAEKGDVDIASADIIVAIGRGIGDEEDLSMFESLADAMGGVVACSRPIVDKGLLPKYRQVGTSGVEVKPKVYLALGISGAFQHLGGIKGNPLIVAVNKDPRAPIFRAAQYGIVANLADVVPALEEKIKELKG